jgi:hypothetical protein
MEMALNALPFGSEYLNASSQHYQWNEEEDGAFNLELKIQRTTDLTLN